MERARERRHIVIDGGPRKRLMSGYLIRDLKGVREQAIQLSEGRAFHSKCKGPEVMCLILRSTGTSGLKQNERGEEPLMEPEKSGDQLMAGTISGTVCVIARSRGVLWGTLSELC